MEREPLLTNKTNGTNSTNQTEVIPSCKLEIKGCVGKEPVGEKMLFEIILSDGRGNQYVAEFLIRNRNIKMMNMAIEKIIPIELPRKDIKLNKVKGLR